jgi:DNA-binding CsgD family transcriptional regulator
MRRPLPVEGVEGGVPMPDPLAEAIRRADFAALWRAISVLPRQQRDALLWREFGGLSYDELATALGVSGAAVESLLFRARRQLRGELRTAFASVNGLAAAALAARNALGWLLSAGGAKVAAGVSVAVVAGTVAVVEPRVADPRARPVRDAAAPTAVPVAARALPTRAPAAAAPTRSLARLRVRVRAEPAPAPTAAPTPVVHEAEPSEREHGPAKPESKDGGGDHGDTATVAASLLLEPVSSGGRAESGDGADSSSSDPGSDGRQQAASGSSGDSQQASESSDSPGPGGGSKDGSEGG